MESGLRTVFINKIDEIRKEVEPRLRLTTAVTKVREHNLGATERGSALAWFVDRDNTCRYEGEDSLEHCQSAGKNGHHPNLTAPKPKKSSLRKRKEVFNLADQSVNP